MKKGILVLLVLFFGSFVAFSQHHNHPQKDSLDKPNHPPIHDSIVKHHHPKLDSLRKHRDPIHDSIVKHHPKLDSLHKPHHPDGDSIVKPVCDSINKPIQTIKVGEVYPNPVVDVANLDVFVNAESVKIKLDIFNREKQLISSDLYTLTKGVQLIKINASGLPKNFYFIKVTGKDFDINRKFVKIQ